MEKALQLFYETMQGRTQDGELKELFSQLGRVEELHRQKLLKLYRGLEPGQETPACAGEAAATLEGGFNFQEFMERNASFMNTVPHVLDLAMMLETQALDLYLRFAHRCVNRPTQTILFAIADEEKVHLARLGRLLEEKLQK